MFEFKWRYRDAVKNNLGLKGLFSMISDLNSVVINMIATGVYMVVNFKICRISRGAHKLTQTPTLIKIKIYDKIVFIID